MSEPLTPEDLEFSADVFDACIGTLVFDTLGAARLQELYPDWVIITPRDWQGHAARLRAAASTIRDLKARLAEAEKRGLLPKGWVITAAEFRTNERDPMTVNGHAVNRGIRELGRDASSAWRGPDPIKRGNGRTVVEAIRAAEEADHADA